MKIISSFIIILTILLNSCSLAILSNCEDVTIVQPKSHTIVPDIVVDIPLVK